MTAPAPSPADFTSPSEVIVRLALNSVADDQGRIRFTVFWLYCPEQAPPVVREQQVNTRLDNFTVLVGESRQTVRVVTS